MQKSLSEMSELVTSRMGRAISEHVTPGGVVGVVTREGERAVFPYGGLTYESSSTRVSEDTLYDVASVTKSIPSACILLRLIDEGKICLDDPLVKYVPEFGNHPRKELVTIKNVLTFTLDLELPSMASMKDLSVEDIIGIVVHAPLTHALGATFVYANSTALFIHLILKKVTGESLDVLAERYFFSPLSMKRSTFHATKFLREEIAPTEIVPARGGEVRGLVHDESTFKLQSKCIPAISGLFSTAPDILTFLHMLLLGGEFGGRRYLRRETVEAMHTNQFPHSGFSIGLGFEFDEPNFMGKHAGDVFGKGGFTGTAVMLNPKLGVALVFLSNAIYPKRPLNADARKALRRDIADIIFDAYSP